MNKKLNQPLRNQGVRAAIEGAGLRYWWVAEELGVACGTSPTGCAGSSPWRKRKRSWPPSGRWRSGWEARRLPARR